ncbi:flavin reductase [Marinilabilia rubra]|uniref:High molecular weight rubredoxin n=1 Tax=Marinilabilia rubra TaxID=2162893 RepID=A0A2U2B6T4_9BACT|nr:flavin reductase [Marinilabilia rubra]PWD98765.1 High molecular weight rubredoxin [Marinilabilia rubra]
MIDIEAFKRMSYGLYIVCSGNQDKGNGYISNSVFQVTAKPAQIAACCHKDNYTSKIIDKTGSYSVSILHNEAETSVIDKFGYQSGENVDKLQGMRVEYGGTGVPIVLNSVIAWIECKVVKKVDVGTHIMFIGEVLQTEVINDQKPAMTYNEFKEKKNRVAPPNAPTHIDEPSEEETTEKSSSGKYQCTQCGFIYDNSEEDTPFEDLPEDWTCPVCGAKKSDFKPI